MTNHTPCMLSVKARGWEERFPYVPGDSLQRILEVGGILVRNACNGNGSCGLCKVRITSGSAGAGVPTSNERAALSATQLASFLRLACQVNPVGDMTLEVLDAESDSFWQPLPLSLQTHPEKRRWPLAGSGREEGLGAVVDIGTTNLSISLVSLKDGRKFAAYSRLNPQSAFGLDVISRLTAAAADRAASDMLSRQVIQMIAAGLSLMAEEQGQSARAIRRVVVDGNTAMLSLLLSGDHQILLTPASWMEGAAWIPSDTGYLPEALGINAGGTVSVLEPLAGFIGSDLLAGLVATGLIESDAPALLIDFGTNSEIALWTGRELWVTSAAGGPAFECCGITCGAPIGPGTVFQIEFIEGRPWLHTVGGLPARGLCGSGMVDLLCGLRRNDILSETGTFAVPCPNGEYHFSEGNFPLALTKRDVDMFQRAKAAVATGIGALLRQNRLAPRELGRVCIGGAFGQFLNIGNAQQLGLLPFIPAERVELCGNTALAGGENCLLSVVAAEHFQVVRRLAKIINLAYWPDFNGEFMENLYLRPFGGNS